MRGRLVPRRSAVDLLEGVVARVPFSLFTAAAVLVVAASSGTLVRPIAASTLDHWGFSLDQLREGRWYTLLVAPFQVYRPYTAMTMVTALLLFVGACEALLGTPRTALIFWLTHLVGYLGFALLIWPFDAAGFDWAARVAAEPAVGATAAVFGCAGACIPYLPPGYRRLAFTTLAAYLLAALAIDRHAWDVEHALAFPAGIALGATLLRLRGDPWPSLVAWPRVSRWHRPAVIAWAVAVMGIVNVLSNFVSPRHRSLVWLEEHLPLAITRSGRHLTLVLGFALILLALGLARGRRQAWLMATAAVAVSLVGHLAKGADLPEALLAGVLLAALVAWRRSFVARSDPPSVRQGYALLALAAVGLPLYGIAGFLVLRDQFAEPFSLVAALTETASRLLLNPAGELTASTRRARWFLDSIPVLGWSGILYGLIMTLRGALAPARTVADAVQSRLLLSEFGCSGTSYMTLWDGNLVCFGPERRAYVGYRPVAGVALALGDPIGPDDALAGTIEVFECLAREQGWTCAFYAATERLRDAYDQLGFRTLKIGEEAIIPLPTLEMRGKEWQSVRTALNRATREGVRFALFDGGTVPEPLREQMIAISAAWLRSKGLPEMGFTLGTIADVDDPNVLVAVATNADGNVIAFVDWLPMYAAHGWVIDLMRRSPDAMAGVMEFLIGSSLMALKARGDQVASLAVAPLADLDRGPASSPLDRVLGYIFERFDTFYSFQSLFAFKKKFQPQWEGIYLAYRRPAELPRIALAILRAHMPGLGPRVIAELVGAQLGERFAGAPDEVPAVERGTAT